MSKYTAVDAEIVRRIRNNKGLKLSQIVAAEVLREAKLVATETCPPDRVVDKRLQALRRQKLIEYRAKTPIHHHGWYAKS